MKSRYALLNYPLIETTGILSIILLIMTTVLLGAYFTSHTVVAVENTSSISRYLYAVNQSTKDRGSISVYDIDAGHRLIKTIQTVPGIGDVRGVVASAVTGKLYAAYRDFSGTGMVYCLKCLQRYDPLE